METLYSSLRYMSLESRCLTSKACSWKTKQTVLLVLSGYWKERTDISQKKERRIQGLFYASD